DYASSVSSTLGLFATPQFVNLVSLGSQEESTTTLDQETGIVTVTVNPTLASGFGFAGGGPYYWEFAPHPPINPEEENLSFSLNYTGGSVLQIEVISQEVYAGETHRGVYRVFGVRPTGIGGVELPREAIEAQGVDLTNLRSLLAVARQEDGAQPGVIKMGLAQEVETFAKGKSMFQIASNRGSTQKVANLVVKGQLRAVYENVVEWVKGTPKPAPPSKRIFVGRDSEGNTHIFYGYLVEKYNKRGELIFQTAPRSEVRTSTGQFIHELEVAFKWVNSKHVDEIIRDIDRYQQWIVLVAVFKLVAGRYRYYDTLQLLEKRLKKVQKLPLDQVQIPTTPEDWAKFIGDESVLKLLRKELPSRRELGVVKTQTETGVGVPQQRTDEEPKPIAREIHEIYNQQSLVKINVALLAAIIGVIAPQKMAAQEAVPSTQGIVQVSSSPSETVVQSNVIAENGFIITGFKDQYQAGETISLLADVSNLSGYYVSSFHLIGPSGEIPLPQIPGGRSSYSFGIPISENAPRGEYQLTIIAQSWNSSIAPNKSIVLTFTVQSNVVFENGITVTGLKNTYQAGEGIGLGVHVGTGYYVSSAQLIGPAGSILLPQIPGGHDSYSFGWGIPQDAPRGEYQLTFVAQSYDGGTKAITLTFTVQSSVIYENGIIIKGIQDQYQAGETVELLVDVSNLSGYYVSSFHLIGPAGEIPLPQIPGGHPIVSFVRTIFQAGEYQLTVVAQSFNGDVQTATVAFSIVEPAPVLDFYGGSLPEKATVTDIQPIVNKKGAVVGSEVTVNLAEGFNQILTIIKDQVRQVETFDLGGNLSFSRLHYRKDSSLRFIVHRDAEGKRLSVIRVHKEGVVSVMIKGRRPHFMLDLQSPFTLIQVAEAVKKGLWTPVPNFSDLVYQIGEDGVTRVLDLTTGVVTDKPFSQNFYAQQSSQTGDRYVITPEGLIEIYNVYGRGNASIYVYNPVTNQGAYYVLGSILLASAVTGDGSFFVVAHALNRLSSIPLTISGTRDDLLIGIWPGPEPHGAPTIDQLYLVEGNRFFVHVNDSQVPTTIYLERSFYLDVAEDGSLTLTEIPRSEVRQADPLGTASASKRLASMSELR
ncbi:MAG: hypothetical protein HYS55_04035, partial [Candidatus Omnitrophica bacterium]|nr:hypothetical protein [Candidatus Omnitrophota bacterium]